MKDAKPQLLTLGSVTAIAVIATLFSIVLAETNLFGHPDDQAVKTIVYTPLMIVNLTIWAFPLAVFLGGSVSAMTRRSLKTFGVWIVASILSIAPVDVFYHVDSDCGITIAINREINLKLSATEQSSLKRKGSFCPTSFTYVSDQTGQPMRVDGEPGFMRGPKVTFSERRD